MKKIIFFVTCAVIIILMLYLNLKIESNDDVVKGYMKNKHGIDVKIVEKKEESPMVSSEIVYIVSPVDQSEVLFTVTVNPDTDPAQIKDTYNQAVQTYKEYHKLETVVPEIKKLGFSGEFKPHPLRYESKQVNGKWQNYISLPLKMNSRLNISSFEEKELDRFIKLIKLIQNSGASIQQVTVEDSGDELESKKIIMKMDHLKDISSREAFLTQLKTMNWELASSYSNKKWEKEAQKIENERFSFGSEYDEHWFNCQTTNEKGECTSILVPVTYQKDGLNQRNPFLKEDLNTIFHFFDHTMKPKPNVEYILLEPDNPNTVRFTQADRNQYKSTEDLIRGLFKK
ncbi:hypothetical protein P4V41_10545 [Fictibacillus nanhaiensis]|uniref:hypothetical protein n=1 Tax=Fictibacillus nanhaiensis TaxID=742169 RepID=UPI002E1E39A0|nr:hypothetical protein [Fictibacillus nanhaiensis]